MKDLPESFILLGGGRLTFKVYENKTDHMCAYICVEERWKPF